MGRMGQTASLLKMSSPGTSPVAESETDFMLREMAEALERCESMLTCLANACDSEYARPDEDVIKAARAALDRYNQTKGQGR